MMDESWHPVWVPGEICVWLWVPSLRTGLLRIEGCLGEGWV
jgi:hypothetical protein